ncbi:MAG: T9SS type A sorting domain-containing protein [Bacteroides sp.]|nr:T9SS type A sorting domain-containing protein [Bacteroides sp.]MCM1085919.1 T9SS type A sorting domain-containing protein [Bacteroides sp.]
MKTTYIPFGKIFGLFWAIFCFGVFFPELPAQNINGTQQLLNRGFEDYDNLGEKSVEPVGWNSFMNAKSAGGLVDAGKEKHLDRAGDRRPGTAGKYSLYVFSTNPIASVMANGNVTTGRINMGSTSPTSAENYNFTDRASAGFNFPFTTVPDSMVVWVKYSPDKASDQGQVNAIIHGDNEIKDPGTDKNLAVAIATVNPGKSQEWVRYSVPFDRGGCGSNDPRYILVSISTNKIPGGGSAKIWVDDILFVYNPEIAVNKLPVSSFNLRDGAALCEIPFTVKGTLPLNSNSAQKNKVVAELSDASGSFANPTVIGTVETDEGGTFTATIPASMPSGEHYKIRLHATDRNIYSEPCTEDIVLMRGYNVEGLADAEQGEVRGGGVHREGATASLEAVPSTGYHFDHWEENGQVLEGAGNPYSFTVTADRRLRAVFAINVYKLTIDVEGEGTVKTMSGLYEFTHGTQVRLDAAAAVGYTFSGYYNSQGGLLSGNQEYIFFITSDVQLKVLFSRKQIDIAASPNNDTLGTVVGGGSTGYGSTVTLTAEARPHCRFVAWMEGNDTVGKEAKYVFTAEENRFLTAIFAPVYHTVSVEPNRLGAGVLTGGGTYSEASEHTTVTLTAKANTGYEFLYWESKKDGRQYEDNPYVVLDNGRLTEDLAFVAHFAIESYNITAEAVPEGAGSISGAGRYEYQDRFSLTATPAEDYDFEAWVRVDHDLLDTTYANPMEPTPIIEGRDRHYKALFALKKYTVSLSVEPAGFGTAGGDGLYSRFDTATLTAEAAEGKEFLYWGVRRGLNIDKVSEDNPYKVEMLQNVDLVAVFSEKRKDVRAVCIPENGGAVEGQGLYAPGGYALLTAVPAFGYRFERWEDAGGNPYTRDTRLHVQVVSDTAFYARFTPTRFSFTLMTEGASALGQVRIGESGDYASRIIQEVNYGDTLHISAKAVQPDYKFTQWRMVYTQDGMLKDSLYSRNAEETYVVGGDSRIVAYFVENAYYISAEVMPEAAGKVRNQGNYRRELWMELVADPNEGYVFGHWETAQGERLLDASDRLQVQSFNDVSYKAVFEPDTLQVQVSVRGGKDRGHATGTGPYAYGKQAVLKAEPAYGYAFAGWYEEDDTASEDCLSKEAEYTLRVTEDRSLSAAFVPAKFTIVAEVEPANTGKVHGAGSYPYLSEAILEAEPAIGYALQYMLLDNGDGSFDTLRENVAGFRMDRDRNVRACFVLESYSLQAFSSDTLRGDVHFELRHSRYDYGSQVDVTATPKSNYVFRQWRDAYGNRISREARFTYTIAGDAVIYADFEPEQKRVRAEPENSMQGMVVPSLNREPYGDVVSVTAVPSTGYEFDSWVLTNDKDKVVSTTPILTVFVSQDTSFEARFKPAVREVRLSTGTLTAGDVRIGVVQSQDTLNSARYARVDQGSEVVLTAVPAPDYSFSSWVRNMPSRQGVTLGTDPVLAVKVDGDMDIEAIFTPKNYKVELIAEPEELGMVRGEGIYGYGSDVTVTAEYGTYKFRGWRTTDGWISAEPEITFTLTRDTVLTACFSRDTVQLSVESSVGGVASGSGAYLKGSPVIIEARASEQYVFDAWYDKDGELLSNRNPYTYIVDASGIVHAGFIPKTFLIETEAGEGGTVLGGGQTAYGATVMLEAVPDEGYRFAGWQSEQLELSDTEAEVPVLGVQAREDVQVTAVFEALKYRISTYVSPLGAGSVTAGGEFNYGLELAFEAKPDADHMFKAWTLNGEEVSTDALLQVRIAEDAAYVAVFAPKRYNVVTEVYPARGGLTYGGGSYYLGDTAQIGIYLYDSVTFKNWSDADFNQVSTMPDYRYAVTHTEIFTASVNAPEVKPNDPVIPPDTNDTGTYLRIYPNPLRENGDLHIESGEENLLSIRLFSVTGKYVLYRKLSDEGVKSASVRLPNLQAGCYFYEIRLAGGSRKRGKLIKL